MNLKRCFFLAGNRRIGESMTNCIIFDLDGTLVNSEYINNYALKKMFQQYDIYYDVHVSVQHYKD
ncbi:hypothetical protein EJA03_15605 [Vibrio pectenicida]|uniref:HAD family hydrolase n=1 Tax=Vibrio pectenicida TaxID=62763 RepID=A0A427U044_9VIBR|nr:hypothetical protein EJA03_15605 [Vibrio pectenicida]